LFGHIALQVIQGMLSTSYLSETASYDVVGNICLAIVSTAHAFRTLVSLHVLVKYDKTPKAINFRPVLKKSTQDS
jgi:hypothetical protein